jgi:hypothetical protein
MIVELSEQIEEITPHTTFHFSLVDRESFLTTLPLQQMEEKQIQPTKKYCLFSGRGKETLNGCDIFFIHIGYPIPIRVFH